MSRTTQFIGLTNDASQYVANLRQLESDTHTTGMFDEEIPLRKWDAPEEFQHPDRDACVREVVQAEPWSSGPMIFTCLELDFGNGGKGEFLQWIEDPNVRGEVDQERGRFWI